MSDNEYLNILPNDFCHIIYWYLNDDLQNCFDINDNLMLVEHWITNGQRENRQYNIPTNTIGSKCIKKRNIELMDVVDINMDIPPKFKFVDLKSLSTNSVKMKDMVICAGESKIIKIK
jgi:hypothetical protein